MLFLCVLFLLDFSGSLHVERTKELYRDLLSVFDKLILPTHASCHVQYILFYLCSFRLVSLPHTVILINFCGNQSDFHFFDRSQNYSQK